MKLSPEDIAWLERWAARKVFLEHVGRVRKQHPEWRPDQVIERLEERRALVLLDHPPGRYLVNIGAPRRPHYEVLDDLSLASATSALPETHD